MNGRCQMRRLRKKVMKKLSFPHQIQCLKQLKGHRKSYLQGLYRLIIRCINERNYFKQLGEHARMRAMTATTIGTVPLKFYASTISRALMPVVPPKRKAQAIIDAIDTWQESRVLHETTVQRTLRKVRRFILRSCDPEELVWSCDVIPASKACLERSVEEGGALRQMVEYGKNAVDAMGLQMENLPDVLGTSTISRALLTVAANLGCMGLKEMKPVAITSLGGKIRVITKHPSPQVTYARSIMACWISIVKRLAPCHAVRGSVPRIYAPIKYSPVDCILFSADLSKATDLIDHDLAIRYANMITSITTPENILRSQAYQLFEYKELQDDEGLYTNLNDHWKRKLKSAFEKNFGITKNGIHMGLGPTWAILSLINIGCALDAGAPANSFSVCGDDLIGYWPEEIITKYILNLQRHGLSVNISKSFRSKITGVFCEGYAKIISPGVATIIWATKMSEKYNSEYRTYRRGSSIEAAANSPHNSILRKKVFHGLPRGPVSLGMGGKKKQTRRDLRCAFARGKKPLSVIRNYDPLSKAIKEATIKTEQLKQGDLPVSLALPWLTRVAKEKRIESSLDWRNSSSSGRAFNRFVNGEVRSLSRARFRTLYKQPKSKIGYSNIPKRIADTIRIRPWKAAKKIERYYSREVIRMSDIEDLDLEETKIALYSGFMSLGDALVPHGEKASLKSCDVVHPIHSRFTNPNE